MILKKILKNENFGQLQLILIRLIEKNYDELNWYFVGRE